jgi:DNA-binding GntR family transcriptional regulator
MIFKQPKSIADQVRDSITTAIIEGTLKPGDRLTEIQLNKQFGISRAPIREALITLEEKGFITILPRKGAFVKEIKKKDVEAIIPIRVHLEGYAARAAIDNMNDEKLENMSRSIKKMEMSAEQDDFVNFVKSHYEFHDNFIQATQNEYLIKIAGDLLKITMWYRFIVKYFHAASDYSIKKHKQILRHFEKKDKDKAEKIVKEHIEAGMIRISKYFD